jgi:membrane protein DedA with SNARE-associated domain
VEHLVQPVIDFIQVHSVWVAPIIFAVSFGESLAFLSLLFPGTAILLAAGTLVPSGVLPLWPMLMSAVAGAVLGDGVSFWIGKRFGYRVEGVWPFTRHSKLVPRGIAFFEHHGVKSIFIGRFFGPMRAVVPLAAGILRMPTGRFWVANVTSAFIWAPGVLFPGAVLGYAAQRFAAGEWPAPVALLLIVALGVGGIWLAFYRARP